MTGLSTIKLRLDIVTRFACALALMLVVLAQRPAAVQAVDLSAFALPDGSVPSICVLGDTGKAGDAADAGCEFCRLASAILLPAPPEIAWLSPSGRQSRIALHIAARVAPFDLGSRSPRGPPELS
jgi:hypothetical protein